MTDWIEYDGSTAPEIDGDAMVEVRVRGGKTPAVPVEHVRHWHWGWDNDEWDIVAYRVIPAPEVPPHEPIEGPPPPVIDD